MGRVNFRRKDVVEIFRHMNDSSVVSGPVFVVDVPEL